MSGGVTRWDTIIREGTHFNQPVPGDGGRACESRAQIPTPGQWGAIPTAQAGPTSSGKERIFSSKRTTEFPSTAKPERSLFIQGQLSPLGKRFKHGAGIACVTHTLLGLCVHSGLPGQPCSREERFAEKQGFNITLRSYLLKL